jgi:hypothetical protein
VWYFPCPSHLPFCHPNDIPQRVGIMKLLIIQSSTVSCYFLCLRYSLSALFSNVFGICSSLSPLKRETNLNHMKKFSPYSVSITKAHRLMLFRETVAVYCENYTEHTNTLCGQNI